MRLDAVCVCVCVCVRVRVHVNMGVPSSVKGTGTPSIISYYTVCHGHWEYLV